MGVGVGTAQCGFSAASPGVFMGWGQRSEEPEDRCLGGGTFWSHGSLPAVKPFSCPTPLLEQLPECWTPALAQVSSLSAQHLPHPRVSPFQASRNSLHSPIFKPAPRLLLDIRCHPRPAYHSNRLDSLRNYSSSPDRGAVVQNPSNRVRKTCGPQTLRRFGHWGY